MKSSLLKSFEPKNYSEFRKLLADFENTPSINFPSLMLVTGSSEFLRRSVFGLFKSKALAEGSLTIQDIECSALTSTDFKSCWSQTSLFEPKTIYVLRRCDKFQKLAAWLKEVPDPSHIKNVLCLEYSDKIPAEIKKALNRLQAFDIHCVEPIDRRECSNAVASIAQEKGLSVTDDAIALMIDSVGMELDRLSNEIEKFSLIFKNQKKSLGPVDIASVIGTIREDHVFELFSALRSRKVSLAQLLIDQLMERGEKAIAINGILSRFARDQIVRGNAKAARTLELCARADLLLKSSRVCEKSLLGFIVNSTV